MVLIARHLAEVLGYVAGVVRAMVRIGLVLTLVLPILIIGVTVVLVTMAVHATWIMLSDLRVGGHLIHIY